ncbi:hypothetical protein Tco_1082305 [Tanacetum coccineum]|uniref:Uncharacterized protein n=1 Tax=Tanacetum coccineum TaxID=301880 RepID=A0ABQ5I040_9ASTR
MADREESHRGLHPRSGSDSRNKVHPAAFGVKSNITGCFYGNTEVQKSASTSSGSTTFDSPFTKYQMMKILSLINEKPFGSANANMAGANQHLIDSTKNMFTVTNISSLNLTVGHPNGTLTKISAIGNLRLTANVVLFDVLVVHEFNDLNLIKTLGTSSEAVGFYLFDVDSWSF